jgi:hypothetical protein
MTLILPLCPQSVLAQDAATQASAAQLAEALKQPQPWTDKSGRVFMGTAKFCTPENAVFAKADGQEVTVKLDQLSAVSHVALLFALQGARPGSGASPMAAPAQPAPMAAGAAPTPAAAPMVGDINANDTAALKAAMGQQVTVIGKVSRVTDLSGGHKRINFEGTREFVIFVPRGTVASSQDWGFETMAETSIRVTGKIVEYNGNPQIALESREQVSKVE